VKLAEAHFCERPIPYGTTGLCAVEAIDILAGIGLCGVNNPGCEWMRARIPTGNQTRMKGTIIGCSFAPMPRTG